MPVMGQQSRYLSARGRILLGALLSLVGAGVGANALAAKAGGDEETVAFIEQHWQRPLAPQGAAPDHFSALEASLDPDACGSCHPAQHQDWESSLHSRAMGPGLMGQLLDMTPHARQEHQACLRCHAPLAEQAESLVAELEDGRWQRQGGESAIRDGLHRRGLVCAACHVRQMAWYGPPRRDGSEPAADQPLPHNGWTASRAFQDSRFCASCHQFQPGEYALNGKLLENTYNEWRESRYAQEGVTCQDCHMPGRRHLWRGIHDPDMVRQGVTITPGELLLRGGILRSQLALRNSGTGHRFPTYVTPQVVLEGYQETAAGERIAGTEQYFVVARRITLDLSQEIFDTRLAPGETATLDYEEPLATEAQQLVWRVWVQPDFFYQQFYRSVLQSGQSLRGQDELKQALEQAGGSRFTLYEQRISLVPPA